MYWTLHAVVVSWRKSKLICLICIYFLSSVLKAAELNYILGVSIAKQDNINLVLNPVREEWVKNITGGIILVENSPSLVANIRARLSAFSYQNQQQQDRVLGNINAIGKWIILPKKFEWVVSDVLTQSIINPLKSNILTNQQDTNSFNTGPNYFLRLNSNNNLNFEIRAGRVTFSKTTGDNTRVSSVVRWEHQINSSITSTLNWELAKLAFDDSIFSDYTRKNLYARVDYIKANNTYAAEVGLTDINYISQNSVNGDRYLLSINNKRTQNSSFQFFYSRRITDTGTALLNKTAASINSLGLNSAASNIYIDNILSIQYINTSKPSSFSLSYTRSIQDYKIQNTFDRESNIISALTSYNFNQISSISFNIYQKKTKYVNIVPQRNDLDTSSMLTYSYNSRKGTNLSLIFQHLQRKSSVYIRSYKDNKIMLKLTYTSK